MQRRIKLKKKCFVPFCKKKATTKEHVPPKGLFPKGIYQSVEYRKHLVTVPCCKFHNSQKSRDDEYFKNVINCHFGSNGPAQDYYLDKFNSSEGAVGSAISFIKQTKNIKPIIAHNQKTGRIYQSAQFDVDFERLHSWITKIVQAIYYYDNQKHLTNKIEIFGYSLMYNTPKENEKHEVNKQIILQLFKKYNPKVRGSHPHIFFYQVLGNDQEFACKLTFSKGFTMIVYSVNRF